MWAIFPSLSPPIGCFKLTVFNHQLDTAWCVRSAYRPSAAFKFPAFYFILQFCLNFFQFFFIFSLIRTVPVHFHTSTIINVMLIFQYDLSTIPFICSWVYRLKVFFYKLFVVLLFFVVTQFLIFSSFETKAYAGWFGNLSFNCHLAHYWLVVSIFNQTLVLAILLTWEDSTTAHCWLSSLKALITHSPRTPLIMFFTLLFCIFYMSLF